MTRSQAKQKLIDLGIAEPTEEQISSLLNSIGEEVKTSKAKADALEQDASKKEELENQVAQLLEQVGTLKKSNTLAEIKAILATSGLAEDQYSAFMNGFVTDDIEASKAMATAFVTTISKAKEAEAERIKTELMNGTDGIGSTGSSGSSGSDNEDPADIANAKKLNFGAAAPKQEDRDFYLLK